MDMKSHALDLASKGIAVFPVGTDKKPRNSNGFHGATTDPEAISRMDWDGGGIGAAIPDGTFVVDIDPRHSGDKTVKALVDAGLSMPATRMVRTQGGGTHRYYRLPEEFVGRSLKGTLGPGVDIKAAGRGYVLVPPTPGYELKFDREPAEAPPWLLDEIVKPETGGKASEASPSKFFEQFEHGTAYGRAALEREIGRLLTQEEGGRNNALNRAAFALAQLAAGGELSEEEAISRLELAGERMGLEPREIGITIRSGWAAGLEEPRQATPREDESTVTLPAPTKDDWFVEKDPAALDEAHFWLNWQVDEPPPPFYLFPVVPKNAYVLVYGATESSKSMVFLALAAEASHRGIRTSIYSLENPPHIDRDRTRRLRPDPSYFRITNQPIDINDARQVHALAQRESNWPDGGSTDWLIFDTYSHAFNSRSEDGNAKAIEFARRIRWIMAQVGCTVILVDHTGYADHGEPRDASAKRQQVDMAIYMERSRPWVPGQGSHFRMENKKSARFGNPFKIEGEIADKRPGRDLLLRWTDRSKAPKWEEAA